jgi:hypothetical protein
MNVLARAAFGDDPGRWPLPAAGTPLEAWQRAVAAGGQGRYASGFAELAGSDAEARADALTGLAADALGVGRFAASARLLQRAHDVVGDASSGRLPVRLAWVSAELAMFTGAGGAAVRHAEHAVSLSTSTGSARHAVKSDVVLAAALCSTGELEASRRVADAALATTERLGLVPLTWALSRLLCDIGSAKHAPDQIAAIRDESADAVRRRGGVWAER